MKYILLIISLLAFTSELYAQKRKKRNDKNVKVIYKYKKYQKFDFDEIVIEGGSGGPGDLSISPSAGIKVVNKLPYRLNFNPEIRKGIERIR